MSIEFLHRFKKIIMKQNKILFRKMKKSKTIYPYQNLYCTYMDSPFHRNMEHEKKNLSPWWLPSDANLVAATAWVRRGDSDSDSGGVVSGESWGVAPTWSVVPTHGLSLELFATHHHHQHQIKSQPHHPQSITKSGFFPQSAIPDPSPFHSIHTVSSRAIEMV